MFVIIAFSAGASFADSTLNPVDNLLSISVKLFVDDKRELFNCKNNFSFVTNISNYIISCLYALYNLNIDNVTNCKSPHRLLIMTCARLILGKNNCLANEVQI